MADAREPYLVQVTSIDVDDCDTKIEEKMWVNVYYITRIHEARKSDAPYRAGARWAVVLTSGLSIWVDDEDCEKIITNINGSY